MTQLPDDDRELAEFLRRHRPPPPQASFDLEERLLATIAKSTTGQTRKVLQPHWYRSSWLPPMAIAASLLVGFISYRNLAPVAVSDTEIAALESFIETSWNDTVSSDTSDDVLRAIDNNSD